MANASVELLNLPNLVIEADGSVAETFLHGVDLKNGVLVHNIGVAGRLLTVDFLGVVDPNLARTHRTIGSIPIPELASTGPYENAVSPRSAGYLIPAAILDSGQKIVNGFGEPRQLTPGQEQRLIETRNIELKFEEGRRLIAPTAPSRLSCIWLAENSDAGRAVILSMLPNAYITAVRVEHCAAAAIADANWFDDYLNFPKPDFIENYWKGKIHPKISMPEILVDGQVTFTDPQQLAYIKENGKKLV